ncbi:MAG: hypothetical protein U0231_05995 [Nitrospiraceae bacterium]
MSPPPRRAPQHYDNFAERFAPFPTKVALLSRFQSSKETKAIVKDVAAGVVDVVIGTHRLLQKDVQFRNLGLVIIDEEQWFGVKHKERLKQLRTGRRAHAHGHADSTDAAMAMATVRDLDHRHAAAGAPCDPHTSAAVQREGDPRGGPARTRRGGQVYFVHNRVVHGTDGGLGCTSWCPKPVSSWLTARWTRNRSKRSC